MEALAGEIAIETSAGPATVRVVEEATEPEVAVIVAVPCPALVARPLLTIATVALDELHVATEVTSCVLPSVYVPVAVNCWVVPSGIEAFVGEIAIETSAAGFTTSDAVALTPVKLIPIVVVPEAS